MADEKSAPDIRFHWVDALRGAAALAIVVFHYHHFYLADAFDRPALPPIEAFPYAGFIWPLYSEFASKAVELFWLISGFVFAHVYLPRRTTAWQFGIARFARLYPLHVITLLYVAGVQALSLMSAGHWQIYANNDTRHFALQLFMSSNWSNLSRGLSFNGPIWSVSYEIVVYGIFFVALLLLRRSTVLVSLALGGLFWTLGVLDPDLPLLRNAVFICAGYFFLGTLLYSLRPMQSATRTLAVAALGAGAAITGGVLGIGHLTISGVAVAMVSLAAGLDRVAPRLGSRLSPLGDISYSLYLVHVPLQMTILLAADLLFDGSRGFADSALTLPVYVGLSVLLATIVHHRFERPVGKLIRTKAQALAR